MRFLHSSMTSSNTAGNWIVRPQPNVAAQFRIFCFPYAGGGASVFRNWWRAFPSHIEVCSILPPGREHRLSEKPFTEFEPYLHALTEAIEPWLTLPCAFFGHSLGSLVAFETARRLRSQSKPIPQLLFVSAGRAPQVPFRDRRTASMADPEFIEELRRLNGTPAEVLDNLDLMELLLPVIRADFMVYESYRFQPGALLDIPIHAFGGQDDHRVTHADLDGWSQYTTASSSVRIFPGDHFFLNPAQRAMIPIITAEIERSAIHAH